MYCRYVSVAARSHEAARQSSARRSSAFSENNRTNTKGSANEKYTGNINAERRKQNETTDESGGEDDIVTGKKRLRSSHKSVPRNQTQTENEKLAERKTEKRNKIQFLRVLLVRRNYRRLCVSTSSGVQISHEGIPGVAQGFWV